MSKSPCCQEGKLGYVRQQCFFKDSIKDFANDRRQAYGCELSWVCCAGLGSQLRGANVQGPGRFELKC